MTTSSSSKSQIPYSGFQIVHIPTVSQGTLQRRARRTAPAHYVDGDVIRQRRIKLALIVGLASLALYIAAPIVGFLASVL